MIRIFRTLALLLFVTVTLPVAFQAQSVSANPDRPFVVEYYYKAKWGHADEFLKLFKKNHYPVLKKEMEMGRIAKVWMDQPRYHTTEDGRWDFRVTIVFKNATVANEPFDEAALQKQMYPDQETFQREEQRRFEILDGHWDLPVKTVESRKIVSGTEYPVPGKSRTRVSNLVRAEVLETGYSVLGASRQSSGNSRSPFRSVSRAVCASSRVGSWRRGPPGSAAWDWGLVRWT